MSQSALSRHAGPIALTAGLLFVVGQLATFATLDRDDLQTSMTGAAYRMSALLLLLGFAGLLITLIALHGRVDRNAGPLGAVGVGAAAVGTMVLAGDWWFETYAVPFYAGVAPEILDIEGSGWLAAGGFSSYLLFAVGWALFGFASLRSRAFPTLVCVAVMITAVVGYLAVMPPFGAPLGLALAWLGVTLIRTAPAREEHQSVPA